ncbi:MAG: biotin transporter BioY [Actinobacteria bacterium]|nr:biotin transporter BioY [Actinomycetota bacterium]
MSISTVSPRVLVETVSLTWVRNAVAVLTGTAFISVLAQVSIPLPFTPVPLTGQTLAILLTAGALGTWRSMSSSILYLGLAVAGLPVLAPQPDGTHVIGTQVFQMASFGYVVGFIVASFVVGKLSERGLSKSILGTTFTMLIGNVVIYTAGLINLKNVTGADWSQVFAWGLTPFLIGDLIKVVIAANLLPATWKLVNRSHN